MSIQSETLSRPSSNGPCDHDESLTPLPELTAPTPSALGRLAEVLATRRRIWFPMLSYPASAREERFATRVAGGRGWEAWLLTWLPGQGTGLHDHGGSAGAFTVLLGELSELSPADHVTSPAPVNLRQRVVTAGQVRSFGRRHVHDVQNTSAEPAASIHVYGPVLSAMTRYDLDQRGRLRVTSRERAGVDW